MSDIILGHAKHHRKVMPDAKMQRDPGIGLPSRGGAPQDECGQRSGHTFRGQYGRAVERDQQVRLAGWVAPGAPVPSGWGGAPADRRAGGGMWAENVGRPFSGCWVTTDTFGCCGSKAGEGLAHGGPPAKLVL